ncbi:GFA family protein [Leptolyngbya sp. FACHB-541]|uniref:GFA family protein n=1 Tax=Leptolyngbya sp. FACHB-541 TaxID=2692810 RepID=UPI0016825A8A|nr:GFA family protein [Leptolyngbya sp. FACHB-541]MBD2000133.1 GFA family protein [Leptolyngbya sp. FACHB-541]
MQNLINLGRDAFYRETFGNEYFFTDVVVAIDGSINWVSMGKAIADTTSDYRGRYFCPVCGSSVFSCSGDEIEIPAGTFDTPNQVTPTYELWICRRENWLPPFNVARRYERDREGTARTEP